MKNKTKVQVDMNLRKIEDRLTKIENILFWYVEVPIKKKLELLTNDFIKKVSKFAYFKGENDFDSKGVEDYQKGDIFIRSEDWNNIKKQLTSDTVKNTKEENNG